MTSAAVATLYPHRFVFFFFSWRQLCDICLAWLGDNVFSIRVAATDNLKRLADHFGTQWARDHILPKVGWMGLTFVPSFFGVRYGAFVINGLNERRFVSSVAGSGFAPTGGLRLPWKKSG